MTELTWQTALERPDLLAPPTVRAIEELPPQARGLVEVAEIDPAIADTEALAEATDVELDDCANCLVVLGRRGGDERIAACLVLATTKADVNKTIRTRLDARKASFMSQDRAVEESAMEYGGITPLGLPAAWGLFIDSRVEERDHVVIGSGRRVSKVRMPGSIVAHMAGAEVVQGLAL